MMKQLATLHAGLISRAAPPACKPPVAPEPVPPAATVTPLRPWQPPRMLALRPVQVEVMPAPVSESTPMPQAKPKPPAKASKRRATTLRLDQRLYARLRLAREELHRSGQSILVEALDEWLRSHQRPA